MGIQPLKRTRTRNTAVPTSERGKMQSAMVHQVKYLRVLPTIRVNLLLTEGSAYLIKVRNRANRDEEERVPVPPRTAGPGQYALVHEKS